VSMQSSHPPTCKRAVLVTIAWMLMMLCLLAWLGHMAISHVWANLAQALDGWSEARAGG
jgi:hypothetical protein